MMKRIFVEHPETVGETYGEHFVQATSFSIHMLKGSVACFVHALVPCLFTKTGSETICALHDRMVENRHRQTRREGVASGVMAGSEPR